MFKNKPIVIGLFSFLMIFSFILTSHAELWELIVDVNVEKGAIYPGETVRITGKIVNHAYIPVEGIEVFVRTGSDSTKVITNSEGEFKAEFRDFQRIPGTYIVNIVASGDRMTGLSSSQFQVKGEISQVSALQQKLSTEEARKYLSANKDDFKTNPIGQTLFKYYHGLLDKLVLEHKEAQKTLAEQKKIEQEKIDAEKLREQAIKEYGPNSGIYEGYQYEKYIANLNPEIRDLVINQLNFTNNMFKNAQETRDIILANGGTNEEARQVYLDMISIPKETLEKFNEEKLKDFEERIKDKENSKNQE